MNGRQAGESLPTANDSIDINGIEFDAMTYSADLLTRDQGGTRAEEAIENDVAADRNIHDSIAFAKDSLKLTQAQLNLSIDHLAPSAGFDADLERLACIDATVAS